MNGEAPEDMRLAPSPPSFAPVVVLDTTALLDNLAGALAEEGAPRVVDARRDGWHHGAALVASTAVSAGAAAVLVETGIRSAELGVDAQLLRFGSGEVLAPERIFGLPDAAGALQGRPVMSLRGRVLAVKQLREGEAVSYGYTYRAARDTRIALVTGGYGQGIVRVLGNQAQVAIGGRLHPIVGRVAMDVSVVEVGDAPLSRGDEVVFFGDPAHGAPPLAAWATASGFSSLELAGAVGRLASRIRVAR